MAGAAFQLEREPAPHKWSGLMGPRMYPPTQEQGCVTWARIKAFVEEVKQAFGPEYDFELLHRGEGGLLCTKSPGYVSGGDIPANPHKSFRFCGGAFWPSINHRFVCEDDYLHNFFEEVQDRTRQEYRCIAIEATTKDCPPWTRDELDLALAKVMVDGFAATARVRS